MTWTKKKIVAVATLGLLLSSFIVSAIIQKTSEGSETSPFKFANKGDNGILTPNDLARFTSNIPIITLRTKWPGPVSTSKSYSSFTMEIYEPGKNEMACLGNAPTLTTHVGLRLHGMVSRAFPKLSYRLKLQDETGQSQPRPLLGMPADADWLLQGPWLDKSLIRNAFSYDLAKGRARVATAPQTESRLRKMAV